MEERANVIEVNLRMTSIQLRWKVENLTQKLSMKDELIGDLHQNVEEMNRQVQILESAADESKVRHEKNCHVYEAFAADLEAKLVFTRGNRTT